MKVGLVSLGCVKNQVDAEQMLSLLLGEGYEFTADASEAEGRDVLARSGNFVVCK